MCEHLFSKSSDEELRRFYLKIISFLIEYPDQNFPFLYSSELFPTSLFPRSTPSLFHFRIEQDSKRKLPKHNNNKRYSQTSQSQTRQFNRRKRVQGVCKRVRDIVRSPRKTQRYQLQHLYREPGPDSSCIPSACCFSLLSPCEPCLFDSVGPVLLVTSVPSDSNYLSTSSSLGFPNSEGRDPKKS